jgi:hypothetical protein
VIAAAHVPCELARALARIESPPARESRVSNEDKLGRQTVWPPSDRKAPMEFRDEVIAADRTRVRTYSSCISRCEGIDLHSFPPGTGSGTFFTRHLSRTLRRSTRRTSIPSRPFRSSVDQAVESSP